MSNFQISARDQFDNPSKIFEQITYANPSGAKTTRHRRGAEPLAYNTFSLGEILMRSPAVGNPADALEKYQAIITGTMSSFWNSEDMSVFNPLLPSNIRELLENYSPDKEAGFGTDSALDGSGGGDGGNLGSFNIEGITPSTKSLPSGVRPVTRVGARVVREVLGFDGTIGGMRAYSNGVSDHETGHAIDVMVGYGNARQKQQGDMIAEFFRHNRNALEVKYVIWYDKICSSRPDSKGNPWGWRPYTHRDDPNRRNPTLRHLDHPHISFLNRPAPNNPRLEWPNGTMVGSRSITPVEAR